MARGKMKLQHHREKLQLKTQHTKNRLRIADLQDKNAQIKAKLERLKEPPSSG